MVNLFGDNFSLTSGDVADICIFKFYQQIIFFGFLCLVSRFVTVDVLLAKGNIFIGLLRGWVLEARCAVQGLLFSNLFIHLYGYI